MKKDTKIVHAGRDKKWTGQAVNPPVYHASTILFDTVKDLKFALKNFKNKIMFYGRRGTPTHFAFRDAMTELEGGHDCLVYPSGIAAVSAALLSFLRSGDHLLMVDTCYGPTRAFCNKMLKKMGIETTYYDPMIGDGIKDLIKDNTKVIFTESPGSITMEIQDIPAISKVAKKNDIILMIDNTYGNLVNFNPYDHGVDLSIQAATKYIVGHSDAMLGTITCTEKLWPQLQDYSYYMGQTAAPDDINLAMRGIRTIKTRIKQHENSALKVAKWLETRDEVDLILHPAFKDCPGHEIWKRDFNGSNGLFSFTLKQGSEKEISTFLDTLNLFKMGFSWGGFESLAMSFYDLKAERDLPLWDDYGPLIRLHIGLEDADDLIADLEKAFDAIK
ncbi:cystathionine beta-lyase [Pseudemcibacter aquimaris]|uniref:cystathionine beta-lyase n=1 Tax=Pseudemcibacter aquimaris TaxID=2857064 RepID=UPI002012A3FF|nr:cystathionine beta-lyase [Pseudemcibacter aquimaris]MCC3860579.1 cystathionine beta-lyase [Pseudemcibacter aquimaris]WDU59401.1 cystathionine beta-lyase [Pseudemcibacter aquimaris]